MPERFADRPNRPELPDEALEIRFGGPLVGWRRERGRRDLLYWARDSRSAISASALVG
jgi:hypothetical protein